MIKKESIENLKNHLDVVDVVSQFIELKKSGANFKACCPFHGETTPSFVVSPAKQIYHCFGCGAGGDSIKFVMEYEKLSYPETIEKLASMYNFNLEYDNNNEKQQDIKVLEEVNKFYQKLFVNNSVAKEYIKDRGISDFSIEKFEIGYAPVSIDTINFLKSNHFNLTEAIDLGIIDTGTNGLYSRFIERITFPIYSINGKLVGFGGRTITGHNAKYVNSPQTKLFNKSRLLYGYHLAKQAILKKGVVIVTEGYLDVIMLHQVGFDNAVATLGTALTAEHLPLLLRLGNPKIILSYDGDKAGLNAANKGTLKFIETISKFNTSTVGMSKFENYKEQSIDIHVVIFENGLDPADMVKNGRTEELSKMFENAQPFNEFCIDKIISEFDIKNPLEKNKAINEIKNFLNSLNPILQEEYIPYIAKQLNIRENLIHVVNNQKRQQSINLSKIDIAELCIIKSILEKPKRLDSVLDIVDTSMFEFHKNEFELVLTDIENPSLNSIILNEKLENYDDERLNQELLTLVYKFYTNKLTAISYDKSLDFKQKANLIRKIKDNIYQLKQGKLVSYNL